MSPNYVYTTLIQSERYVLVPKIEVFLVEAINNTLENLQLKKKCLGDRSSPRISAKYTAFQTYLSYKFGLQSGKIKTSRSYF